MNFDPDLLVTPLTVVLTSLVMIFLTSKLEEPNYREYMNTTLPLKLRGSKSSYLLLISCMLIGCFFFWIPYEVQAEQPNRQDMVLGWLIFGIPGAIWILYCLIQVYNLYTGYLLIDSEIVEFEWGRKVRRVNRSEITDVGAVYLDLLIMTKDKRPAMKIPMAFKGISIVLRILQNQIVFGERLDGKMDTK